MYDLIVIGGGAAGFYGAIHVAETRPDMKVLILEQGKQVLGKVKVSGGGRCNVTHAQFNPALLVQAYPRGEKELRGPFNSYNPQHTVDFFNNRGIELKVEDDGRMFPVSNSSQTIIDCFMEAVSSSAIELKRNSGVVDVYSPESNSTESRFWEVKTKLQSYRTKNLLIASGSGTKMWNILKRIGHNIIDPVPSLFTFNIKDPRIDGIPGVSVNARVELLSRDLVGKGVSGTIKTRSRKSEHLVTEGPLLITHWGMSGPAILKLSSRGARILNEYNYRFRIRVNWMPEYHQQGMYSFLIEVKNIEAKKTAYRTCPVEIPRRLWGKLVIAAGISQEQKWADLSKKQLQQLAAQLTSSEFLVDGKSTFKEEFVTAGGVDLKEIDFKTFGSKIHEGLYFAGEVLNIDALTGGYNFQSAWSGAYLAARAISESNT
ncbi:MAG: NAD(P)/FAD-dependent oxidoreductase [Muriicola sp.]|nr:NAD(P)/FAD-dependent oxidoreductase [Muriicola sp.]